ncbi:hypothetical protein GCM10027291_31520 [Telluribacter humicola]
MAKIREKTAVTQQVLSVNKIFISENGIKQVHFCVTNPKLIEQASYSQKEYN